MTIPDFSFTVPTTVAIGTTQNRNNAITMSVAKNNAFAGVVTTTRVHGLGRPDEPAHDGQARAAHLLPVPATPATTITWTTFSTTAAPVGISTIWILGHSSSPYLTDHYYPVAVNIGGVVRDFTSTGSGQVFAIVDDRRHGDRDDVVLDPELQQHGLRRAR